MSPSCFSVSCEKKEFEARVRVFLLRTCHVTTQQKRELRKTPSAVLQTANPSHLAFLPRRPFPHPTHPHRLSLFASSPPHREARVSAGFPLPLSWPSPRDVRCPIASDHPSVLLIRFSFRQISPFSFVWSLVPDGFGFAPRSVLQMDTGALGSSRSCRACTRAGSPGPRREGERALP
jgi:hypothetical protein